VPNQTVGSSAALTANRWDRNFWPIAVILLVIMAAAQIGSAIQESPTNDEAIHLTAGYVYLTTGSYGMDLSHPPLGRVLAALPMLALPVRRISSDKVWLNLGTLIRDNPAVRPSTVLISARLVVIALTLLFGLWLSWWTRRRFGAPVALLALTFFAFDPNLLAHGHYITTDLIASFGIFLACTLWADFLEEPSWKALAVAVGALGLALISKFSALFLLIAFPLLYAIAWRIKPRQAFFTLRGAIRVLLVTIVGVGGCITLAYAPAAIAHAQGSWIAVLRSATHPSSSRYMEGLNELIAHDSNGNPTYLLGRFSRFGWWEYFPVAFLVKTPTGVLLACLLAAASLFYLPRRPVPMLPLACITLPPAIYFLAAMHSSIDIGVRHILPVYPFLYVFVAFLIVRYSGYWLRWTKPYALAALIALTCTESLWTYPHYLAFFNWPSGGPNNGAHYLLDSNLDWGQDADNLKRYIERNPRTPFCTAIFGPFHDYVEAHSRDLFATDTSPQGLENLNCVAAVSANFVEGLYIGPEKFAALRRREPFAKIGHSIYLYDLRH
jgi:hypothetical protein